MKAAQPVTAATPAKKSTPFFSKGSGQGLFHSQTQEQPFFSKSFGRSAFIQTKLTVGAPGDVYEREADKMADHVVQRLSNENTVQTKPLHPLTPVIQKKCTHCEEEEKLQKKELEDEPELLNSKLQKKAIFESNEEPPDDPGTNGSAVLNKLLQRKCADCEKEDKLQKKPEGAGGVDSDIEKRLNSSKGGGAPLTGETRSQMEAAFGADFSAVRVHNNSSAVQMSKDLNAQAFTHGNDIYFNEGKYDASGSQGKHLLAHELTHTLQQKESVGSAQTKIQRWPDWVSDAAGWVSDTASDVGGAVVDSAEWVGGKVEDGARWVGGKVEAGAEWVGDQLSAAARWVIDRIRGAIDSGKNYLKGKWEDIKNFGRTCFEDIKNGFGNLIHFVTSPLSGFMAALSGMNADILGSIWNTLKTGANSLWTGINSVINGVLQFGEGIWNTVSGFISNIFDTVAGLFDSTAFDLLPDWIQDELRSVLNGLRALWNEVSSFWTDLLQRLTGTIRDILAAVQSFVENIINYSIDKVISMVRSLKEVYEYVQKIFADPEAFIQPILVHIAGKLNAEAPPQAVEFTKKLSAEKYPGNNPVVNGGTVQKKSGGSAPQRGTATLAEVIEGISFYIVRAWGQLDILKMLWDTVVNMFWPPATIRAIYAEFSNLWNVEWSHTLESLYAPRNFFDDPIGCLHDVWSNFLILLEFPLALWRTLNHVIGLLMGYITILMILIPAIAGGIAAVEVGVVPGILAGAAAGLEAAAALGELLMASYILAETLTVGVNLTQLFTARQTCEQRQQDMLTSASSMIGMGVAITLQVLMALLAELVGMIVRAVRGIGKGTPVPQPQPQPQPVPQPLPQPQPVPAPVPQPQPVPASPVPAVPAPAVPGPQVIPFPVRPPTGPTVPAVPGGGTVIPFPTRPAPVSPTVPGRVAAKFEEGAHQPQILDLTGHEQNKGDNKAGDSKHRNPDLQTFSLPGATVAVSATMGQASPGGIDKEKCEKEEKYHRGTFDDPIPINWYKRPQDYPQQISIIIDGQYKAISMFSEIRVRRLRADRRLVTIGVADRNRFEIGRMLLKGTTNPRTGAPQRLFREIMEDREYRQLPGKDADHVIDLQFGGEDGSDTALRNIWPLRSDINKRPVPPFMGGGGWNEIYRIRYINSGGDIDERPIGEMHGFWFKIIGYRYPPVPNPGGEG